MDSNDCRVQANQRAGRAGRTRPGKCYRLYPSAIYEDEFLDVTIPEIQRSSLAGSVLYLKSLDLPDIDILKFDFLDSPSRKTVFFFRCVSSLFRHTFIAYNRLHPIAFAAAESLQDALKQLYLIDAIDENGLITRIGKTMAGIRFTSHFLRVIILFTMCCHYFEDCTSFSSFDTFGLIAQFYHFGQQNIFLWW